jgi:hypothetical protein
VVEVKETIDEKSGASAGYGRHTFVYDLNGARQYKLEKLAGTNHHSSIAYQWGAPIGGQLNAGQYDALVADLVKYLVYMGEPSGHSRVQIGIYTMLFLVLLILVSWLLKRAYWKDVH